MLKSLLSGVALVSLCVPALAQDLPQAGDAWFTAGQATITERLAVQPITTRAKNVILFTADGNGVGTNYAIRLFEGQMRGGLGDDHVQPHEAFPHVALVKTYSTNGQTPDSAPTAAAMNSGIKTKNDIINVPETVAVSDCAAGMATNVKLFSEIASEMGKSVGVISTARITHATPAAVYSRTVNRDWEDNTSIPEGCTQLDIAAQLIEQMKSGVIDIAMGGGRQHFLPESVTDAEGKTGKRTDGRDLTEEAKALGAQVVFADTDFAALTMGNNAPILGLFEASHMKYEHDRTGEPSLAEMTEAAIKALSANENGFYLSIEAGRVDHANHDGNLYRTLTDGVAFNDAIRKALELTNAEDTLIIVTADHEHALAFNGYCGRGSAITGLCMKINEAGVEHTGEANMAKDGKPYTVAGFLNGSGSVLIEQADKTYVGSRPDVTEEQATDPDYVQQALVPMSSETHTGEDVMVFAQGPWAHLFGGTIEQNVIFHVMHHAVTAQ
jgi:alkaline phosphatase